jgi:hypothetical protein
MLVNQKDAFTSAVYKWDGDAMCSQGLYVDHPAWGFHLLEWL